MDLHALLTTLIQLLPVIAIAVVGFFGRRWIKQRDKAQEDKEMKALAYRVRHDNIVRIQGYKIDSIITGLTNVNHNAGKEFIEGYTKEYERLNAEYKLIEP